jgi:hypothetical protein
MKRSLYILEKLSHTINSHQTYFTFNKDEEVLSPKYKKGRVSASKWLNELIFYFIKKENQFLIEFKDHIQEQKKNLSNLEDGDYKQGLFDELNLIEDMINDKETTIEKYKAEYGKYRKV